jgi:hypothetical protein
LGEGVGAGEQIARHILRHRLLRAEELAAGSDIDVAPELERQRPHVHDGGQRIGAIGRGVDRRDRVDLEGQRVPVHGAIR